MSNAPQTPGQDAPSIGFAVLGFFIPLAGLILWIMWKDKTPLKAKSCIKGAIIGFAVNIVLVIINMVFLGGLLAFM